VHLRRWRLVIRMAGFASERTSSGDPRSLYGAAITGACETRSWCGGSTRTGAV